MFASRDRKWLADRHLDDGVTEGPVLHAANDIRVSAQEIAKALESTVVIDGDLTVNGALSIDDNQALIVIGRVECTSFWVGEGKFCAQELNVAQCATFDCWGDDMHYFEVDAMTAPVLCSPTSKLPGTLGKIDCEFVIETARQFEKDSKLFSWIIEDSFDAVYAALKAGERIDDTWCAAHKRLVTNAERRAHLEPAGEVQVSARVRAILEALDSGATAEETELHGQVAVRVAHLDGTKQLSVLNEAELAAFRAKRSKQ